MFQEMGSFQRSSMLSYVGPLALPEQSAWYALYTKSRHEQVVKTQLDQKAIENFLPLYERVSQWKDRKKRIHWPLFPGYVFVKIVEGDRLDVLKTHGAVYIVSNGLDPLPIPEEQILSVRSFVEGKLKCDPHPYLKIGNRVRILEGPMKGVEGILIRKKNKSCLVLSVDIIQRSVSVELDGWGIEPI
jgi:transcription antitermination factor NusG